MRVRQFLTVATVAVVTLGVLPVAAQAADPTYQAFSFDGSGDNPFFGAGQTYSPYQNSVGMSGDASEVSFGTGTWQVIILPAAGTSITTGVHPATDAADATHYGVDVLGVDALDNASHCDNDTGTINIEQVTFLPSGGIGAMAASLVLTCGTSSAPIYGELRYNSTVPSVGATSNHASLDLGSVSMGTTSAAQSVTFTSVGASALHPQTATITGPFGIAANSCSGATLAAGQTCTVQVTAKPMAYGPATGTLKIADDSPIGYRLVSLTTSGKVGADGTYAPVAPARLLDTRNGTGVSAPGAIGAGGVVTLQVAGRGNVPDGASAAVLNLTETGATSAGYLTVWPTDSLRPIASNLNFTAGRTEANSVTVQLGPFGAVNIYNSSKSTQIIADVTGYFVSGDDLPVGGSYLPTDPFRLIDTRKDQPGIVPGGDALTVPIPVDDATAPHVRAVAVNITATGSTASGYLTAWNGTDPLPGSSTLNFAKGATVPNMAIVPTSMCTAAVCGAAVPSIGIYNGSTGETNMIVDIVGYFDDGTTPGALRFHPGTPTRVADSRSGLGLPAALGAGKTGTLKITPTDPQAVALALNITAVAPTASTYITVWPGGPRPNASVINAVARQTVANAAISLVNWPTNTQYRTLSLYNNAGTTNLIVDVAGAYDVYSFDFPTTTPAPTATRTTANLANSASIRTRTHASLHPLD